MASRGSKSKGKSHSKKCRPAPPTFNINIEKFIDIHKSRGIVFGDHNVVHMEENAKRLIEDPKEFRLSRNEVAIGSVNAILCPDGCGPVKGMQLLDLQQRVENQINLLQPGKHISFEDFAGHPIQNFVDRNTDWYVKFKDKGKIMVRLLPKKIVEKMPLKVQGKRPSVSENQSVSATEASDVDLPVTDYETASSDFEVVQKVLKDDISSLANSKKCSYHELDENDIWEKPRHKHKKRHIKRSTSDEDSVPRMSQNFYQEPILKEKKNSSHEQVRNILYKC